MTSDLSKFYRTPKINVRLPSRSNFYSVDQVKLSMDELSLKNPDSLLNGDCLVNIIKSCVPEIKDPRKLLAPDIEIILLGIFFASFGPDLDFKAVCPECKTENNYQVSIRYLIDTSEAIEYPASVESVIDDNTTLVTYVQPYTFETNTRHQLAAFEQNKMMQVMTDEETDSQEKLKVFGQCFDKMVNLKFENIAGCIQRIDIKEKINNEILIKSINSLEEIKYFIANADNNLIQPILNKIDTLNNTNVKNDFDAECDSCKHTWKTIVEFNPVNFFVKSSSQWDHLT